MRRFLVLGLFLIAADSQAAPGNSTVKKEIDHLLAYIEKSNCMYIRENHEHSAADAVKHISLKYRHYYNEITTTEDFIELSASRSSLTGRAYLVRCGETEAIKARPWLLAELNTFRKQDNQQSFDKP
jgi:hypothetical protein